MDLAIDRDTLVQITISAFGVGVFIGGMIVVGILFAEDGMDQEGAIAMIGVVVLFIIVMSGIGYLLSVWDN